MDRDWGFVICLHSLYFADGGLRQALPEVDGRKVQLLPRLEGWTLGLEGSRTGWKFQKKRFKGSLCLRVDQEFLI
jgi:hypothetical protein